MPFKSSNCSPPILLLSAIFNSSLAVLLSTSSRRVKRPLQVGG